MSKYLWPTYSVGFLWSHVKIIKYTFLSGYSLYIVLFINTTYVSIYDCRFIQTYIQIYVSKYWSVTEFVYNFDLTIVQMYGFLKLTYNSQYSDLIKIDIIRQLATIKNMNMFTLMYTHRYIWLYVYKTGKVQEI